MGRTLFLLVCLLAAAGFFVAPYLIFIVAPPEPIQGFSQKIFYFHVPCAWAMLLGALASAAGGAAYLFKGRRWGDQLCASASELAVVFGVIVLTTGPLWAKKAWGFYWRWDVRLTTLLVLFLIFLGVLMARRYGGPARRRVAAGLAIFGAADVPLIYVSVQLWRTMHPKTTVVKSLPPKMQLAFLFSLGLFTLLFIALLWIRFNLERSSAQLDDLAVALEEKS